MRALRFGVVAVSLSVSISNASGVVVSASDASGLSARAEFTLVDPTTLIVVLANTSTGVPVGFSNSDQLLTGVSWDFGSVGARAGEPEISGGNVQIGFNSRSVNFASGNYGPKADVSGEWGYGNGGSGLAFTNFLSTLQSQNTRFPGPNLDGPGNGNLAGPQGGLLASPAIIPVGGLGVIQHEIVATLNLSRPISNLDFLNTNQVRFEFGSDAAFLTVPSPGSATLLAIGAAVMLRRRRRTS